MGAAASVKMLYKDALEWFRQYIDTETYMEDFKSMDKHNENALTFTDVRDWITLKAKKDPLWRIFLTSGPVLTIAHKYACQHGDRHTSVSAAKMVDVTEFKTLLVHLFAISILWSHFQNAEKWEESGSELAGHRLNFQVSVTVRVRAIYLTPFPKCYLTSLSVLLLGSLKLTIIPTLLPTLPPGVQIGLSYF
jgi:hypothetical protein